MVYIYEIELKKLDRIDRGIKRMYGLDPKTLRQIFYAIQKKPRSRVMECDGEMIEKVTNFFRKSGKFGSFLKRSQKEDMDRLRKINSYRGIRLSEGKPVRGQRTHTNAKTSRHACPLGFRPRIKKKILQKVQTYKQQKPVQKKKK